MLSLSPRLRTSLGRSSSIRRLFATTTMSSCCKECHLRFDGCLQLSACIWWWRERTLWHLHWQLQPLTESQFRDVTSEWCYHPGRPVHVVAPRSIQLGTATTASLSAGYTSTWQTGGTQSALWLWPLIMTQRPTDGIRLVRCTAARMCSGTVAFSNYDTENYGIE